MLVAAAAAVAKIVMATQALVIDWYTKRKSRSRSEPCIGSAGL